MKGAVNVVDIAYGESGIRSEVLLCITTIYKNATLQRLQDAKEKFV